MESFSIKSNNKTIVSNGVELVLEFDNAEFYDKANKFLNHWIDINKSDNLLEFAKTLASDINSMFGEGTCKKIFNYEVPFPTLMYEFSAELIQYIKEFKNETDRRLDEINSKYDPNRMGDSDV